MYVLRVSDWCRVARDDSEMISHDRMCSMCTTDYSALHTLTSSHCIHGKYLHYPTYLLIRNPTHSQSRSLPLLQVTGRWTGIKQAMDSPMQGHASDLWMLFVLVFCALCWNVLSERTYSVRSKSYSEDMNIIII